MFLQVLSLWYLTPSHRRQHPVYSLADLAFAERLFERILIKPMATLLTVVLGSIGIIAVGRTTAETVAEMNENEIVRVDIRQ
jgi:hypothetical protein